MLLRSLLAALGRRELSKTALSRRLAALSKGVQMKLSKLPKLLNKAEHCTSRKDAQKILKKAKKLTRKVTITSE